MFEDRKKYLNEVSHNVTVCRNKLDSILKKIGWTHHSLQIQALDSKEIADNSKQGENDEIKKETIQLSEISSESTNLDKTYTDLVQSIANQSNLKVEKKKKDTELLVEMLAMERNAKRRRTSYKNKVHTKNKSHTEIMREVLAQQMELLKGSEDGNDLGLRSQTEPNSQLIELRKTFISGNPHLLWQNVEKYLETKDVPKVSSSSKSEHKDRTRSKERKRSPSRHKRKRSRSHHRHNHKKHKRSHSPKRSHQSRHKD